MFDIFSNTYVMIGMGVALVGLVAVLFLTKKGSN